MQAASSTGPDVRPWTTLILRNLPSRISCAQLASAIHSLGFAGKYDFLYLPSASRTAAALTTNMGYGFANFLTLEDATAFIQAFEGYQFPGSQSLKRGRAQRARIQGSDASLNALNSSAAAEERMASVEPSSAPCESLAV
eukprot:CAMPEP_0204593460 /NCGR_PEP_ID=MMETSP0661-20131031/51522_1 /ASSEMBLY_ACC=CAM_ASM_000606 /TAXON_ID=109239 /ORGANISM="Alexandrium margalefi, Strain AMGDE01CS-322" /LENGTH=139 /DNA_ID=CAMNT_0051603773 /DNA_START=44 /DNA_END=464 /DNA_ORIENTATION=+